MAYCGCLMPTFVMPVLTGTLILIVATLPRNLLFLANLRFLPALPWASVLVAIYLGVVWRHLSGWGPPADSSNFRRESLRANPLPARVWMWALIAGGTGIVTLVVALRLANRMVALPQQDASPLAGVPAASLFVMLFVSSVFAGVVEESAFRGYMQAPLEKQYGTVVAILTNGFMFAVVHLDFTPVLLPYYLAVAAIYGAVAYLTNSILPAIVLHAGGNMYSNADLWLHGRAEWQAPLAGAGQIWQSGPDRAFWTSLGLLIALLAVTVWAYSQLARSARESRGHASDWWRVW